MRALVVFLVVSVAQCQRDSCIWSTHSLSEVAKSAVHKLKWKRLAVIHDSTNVAVVNRLPSVQFLVYEISHDTVLKTILQNIHRALFPEVNIVVALKGLDLLTEILYEADGFDTTTNHSTDWSHHSKWLVLTTDLSIGQNGSIALKNLQNVAVLTYIQEHNTPCSYDLFSLRNGVNGYRFERADKDGPLSQRMFPNTKYRYNRRTLRVSTAESYPFVVANWTGQTDNIPYTGFCIDVLRIIADYWNMTLKFVEPRDGIWGWVDDGMMAQIQAGEIDIIASEMIVHLERAQRVDFITPSLQTDIPILFYKMPPANEPIFLFTRPFHAPVYMVFITVACVVTFLFILIEKLGALPSKTQKKRAPYFCWAVVKSSLRQGDSFQSGTTSGTLLMAFWWMLVVLVSSLYSGNLTASLAANSPLRKFESINEVVDSDYSVGLVPGGIMEQRLENSTNEEVKRLYEKLSCINETDPGVTSNRAAFHIQKLEEKHHVFITYSLNVDSLKGDCSMSRLFFDGMPQERMSFAVQKNSPFKADLDKVMSRLHTRGILGKMWQKWTNQTISRACDGKRKSITITELIGGVIVASAGIVLALVSLSVEWAKSRYSRKYVPSPADHSVISLD